MLLVYFEPGYFDYEQASSSSFVIVNALLIIGLWYMYKSRVIKKGSFVPILFLLLAILNPILINVMPDIMGGGETKYIRATPVILGVLGIFVIGFIIFVYLIYSKKKSLWEPEVLKPSAEKQKDGRDLGLKLGTIIIIASTLAMIILNISGFKWSFFLDELFIPLSSFIGSLIMIGGIYSLYRNKYVTFGTIICVVGSVSNIAYILYTKILGIWGFWGDIPTLIPFYILPIIGVILHHIGKKAGSILCVFIGFLTFLVNFTRIVFFYGIGFLSIFDIIKLEPFLIMIGGYFLYQEHLRS